MVQRRLSFALILEFLATLFVFAASGLAFGETNERLYVDYSETPNPDHLLAFDLGILNPDAEVDLKPGHKLGNRYLAYLSVVEVAPDAAYRDELASLGIPFAGHNPEWNSQLVDVSNPKWRKFVVETLASRAAEKGFDGFFLDTVSSLELLEASAPGRANEFRQGLQNVIRALRERFPDKQIVLNRGFDLLSGLNGQVDGVLVESVFQTFDPASGSYQPVAEDTSRQLLESIATVRSQGLPVYVIDYVEAIDTALAERTHARLAALGCVPFVSTRELQGNLTGPVRQQARRILVLFGHDATESELPRIWPADTTTTNTLQMPLEWMGYELDYHDVGKGLPTSGTGDDYAGVILDEELEFPYRLEPAFLEWLLARRDEGKKLFFLGSYGFRDSGVRQELFQELGLGGTDDELIGGDVKIAKLDGSLLNYEARVRPTSRDFLALEAPPESDVLLSLEARVPAEVTGAEEVRLRFDPIYVAPWGGTLLDPYINFEASEETALSYVDPFALLAKIWPDGQFPAPDTTTRDGLRLFYTHIDGDGFSSLSNVVPDTMCAELLYEDVLKELPYPITVSIVESEIEGLMLLQKPEERQRCIEAARKIFALPNVQLASHSFSHPYIWISDDAEQTELFETSNLELKLTAKYPDIVAEREVAGSISFIDKVLAPEGKQTELMLWSGNCRPSPEALQLASRQGVENMNGGNTILSRRYPGLSAVAPRVISWDGELQVFASNQNEFMYTNGWEGPYFGGFAQVIQTFEQTDETRRLKPVNVYYHFYSAERADALRAIHEIYDWCQQQELHPIVAADFARLTRDCHFTRLFQAGKNRWIVLNQGKLRTFRIPTSLGTPDVTASTNVTGYNTVRDWHYIHTNGEPRVEIALSDHPKPGLRLIKSSSELEFERLTPTTALFRTGKTVRLTGVQFGGLEPGTETVLTLGGGVSHLTADEKGTVRFTLPASERASLKISN